MNDNEIIKALECCTQNDCNSCRYDNHNKVGGLNIKVASDKCKPHIIKDVLALINRQKAEIVDKDVKISELEYDIELMRQEKSAVQSEAIKEFAERLKTKARIEFFCDNGLPKTQYKFYHIEETDIDKLVKEMVGDVECLK